MYTNCGVADIVFYRLRIYYVLAEYGKSRYGATIANRRLKDMGMIVPDGFSDTCSVVDETEKMMTVMMLRKLFLGTYIYTFDIRRTLTTVCVYNGLFYVWTICWCLHFLIFNLSIVCGRKIIHLPAINDTQCCSRKKEGYTTQWDQ